MLALCTYTLALYMLPRLQLHDSPRILGGITSAGIITSVGVCFIKVTPPNTLGGGIGYAIASQPLLGYLWLCARERQQIQQCCKTPSPGAAAGRPRSWVRGRDIRSSRALGSRSGRFTRSYGQT